MIGVFDSGLGGLTIVQELIKQLPRYDYLYFGDNANAPYGDKSNEEIVALTHKGINELFSRGAEIVILGCNTASAIALRRIQQDVLPKEHPTKKVLGIVVPTIEQITGVPWHATYVPSNTVESDEVAVAILATTKTVESNAYPIEIHKRKKDITIQQIACPGLVDLIERDAPEIEIKKKLQACLKEINPNEINALLLGCTHFELIASFIRDLLPPTVTLYEQPNIVAESLSNYLERHPEIEKRLSKNGQRKFLSSKPITGNYPFKESITFETLSSEAAK